MLTKTIRTTAGLLLLTFAACTSASEGEDPLELEDASEPADELASPEERAGATIPAARFELAVDSDEQREAESLRAGSCSLDTDLDEAQAEAPVPTILAPGVADPRFRVEEDQIAASIAAQERRELEDAPLDAMPSVDDETLAAQARYLAQVSAQPGLDAEAKAALKEQELGE